MADTVLQGKYAFVSPVSTLNAIVEQHCDIHVANKHFYFTPSGMPVTKDFKYTDVFNERLIN